MVFLYNFQKKVHLIFQLNCMLATKTYVVGTQWKSVLKTLPLSTTTKVFSKKSSMISHFSADKKQHLHVDALS